jgi:hypothetical protein
LEKFCSLKFDTNTAEEVELFVWGEREREWERLRDSERVRD